MVYGKVFRKMPDSPPGIFYKRLNELLTFQFVEKTYGVTYVDINLFTSSFLLQRLCLELSVIP